MAVAIDADAYAAARLNIFFPGVDPTLDGQCVSLAKWFLQEMTGVPNPQAARGDARYVGHTLVNQGHAIEVPYSDRREGDLITYEYGVYGHIGVVLSGDRTFEENVNWSGVASKIVDGSRVYASRIGSLNETWRHDQHIYRIKTYQGGDMIGPESTNLLRIGHSEVGGWPFAETHNGNYDKTFHAAWDGKDEDAFMYAQWLAGATFRNNRIDAMTNYPAAKTQVVTLTATVVQKDKTIADQQKEIESLKAQVGDNSKWETLKALIRELVGTNK